MEKSEILEILTDWNPWAKEMDTGVAREGYVKELVALSERTNQVLCVSGIRRGGKSTIMRQVAGEFIRKGINKENILIINLEDERFRARNLKLLTDIYEVYLENLKPKGLPHIFIDEVQSVPGWERFVRGVHERKEARIFVSGSSSKLLSREFATLLSGRHIPFSVYPLSLKEFLSFKGVKTDNIVKIIAKRREIKGLFKECLEWGGFPEVVLSEEKRRILLSYFDTIIIKDVVERFNIRRMDKLKEIAKYYLTNVASHMSFQRISKFLNMPLSTVERYSDYLETAVAIFFLRKFSYSLKEQAKAERKVYSIDVGLSNAIGFNFMRKEGKAMENLVAIELKRRQAFCLDMEVYYWKDYQQREVDFVVKKGRKVEELIQVCKDVEEIDTLERERGALLKAMEKFKVKRATIITEDLEKEEDGIIYKPLWKWLLDEKWA